MNNCSKKEQRAVELRKLLQLFFCTFEIKEFKVFRAPFVMFSIYIWNQFVRNIFTELIPVFSVFILTTSIIPVDSMEKKDGHINDIEVGEDVSETTSHTHGERNQKITDIIKMSRKTPEAAGQENRFVSFSVRRTVIGLNELGWFTPDLTITFFGSN